MSHSYSDGELGYVNPMHTERGKLLFRVTAEHQRQRLIWLLIAAAMAVLLGLTIYEKHRPDWGGVIFFTGYAITFAMARKVAFYENGVHFPQEPSGGRGRFISWQQVERFYWDGDVLTIVPNAALLTSGGGNIGLPPLGGSVRIPMARHVEVVNLLGRVPASSRLS